MSQENQINPIQFNNVFKTDNVLHTNLSKHSNTDQAITQAFKTLQNIPSNSFDQTQQAINTLSQALRNNPKNSLLVSESIQFLSSQLKNPALEPSSLLEIFIYLNKNQHHFSSKNKAVFNQFLTGIKDSKGLFAKIIRSVWLNPDLLMPDNPHTETLTSNPNTLKSTTVAPKQLTAPFENKNQPLTLQYAAQQSTPNKAIYLSNNVRLQIAEELRDVKMDITFTRMLAQYFGGKRMGFIMAIISLGYLPPIFFISPLVYDLLVKMAALKGKRNLFKCAFVAESVASIGQIEKAPNIELIPSKLAENESTYISRFQDLIDQHFLRIISLHTHPFLSKTHKLASHAATNFSQKIDIQALKTNSLGLGMLVHKLNKLIKEHYSPDDILDFIRQCEKSTRYFAIPNQFSYQNAASWLDSSLQPREKFNLKLLNYTPVFELKDTFRIVAMFKKKEEAFQFLNQQLSEHKKQSKQIHALGIEYRSCYREAKNFQNNLRRHFRRVHQNIQVSDSITAHYMGDDFIGVCII